MTSDEASERRARRRSRVTLAGIVVGVALGLGFGVASYTFVYAKGWSYLTNDPAACANCHVMQDHYDAWLRWSHRSVAFQRRAQFYLDFIEAENSTGFHASQEAARILAESIDFSRKGQNALHTAD
jgi:nitrate/TMAO reductase-like tetraheme cytochrome c subunit